MTTESPKKTRNTNSPLSAGEAFDRIASMRDSRDKRRAEILAEFDEAETELENTIASRVVDSERLGILLTAYEVAKREVAARAESDAIPERLREPLSESRLAVAKR